MDKMRRFKQEINQDYCLSIIEKADTGILGLVTPEHEAYQVPLNYAYKEGKLYFHCAKSGKKLDCILFEPQVSFCIIEKDEVLPASFSTRYGSVLIQGEAHLVQDNDEKEAALWLLIHKYSPDFLEEGKHEIEKDFNNCEIVCIQCNKITGKVSKDRLSEFQ